MARPIGKAFACLAAAALFLLAGCLISPGKFNAVLDLRKDGHFTFTYSGEIYVLALSRLADMGSADVFKPEDCHDDDFKKRACTAGEIAEQRRTWNEGKAARKKDAEQQSQAMRAMLGGIDPADPRAAQELAARLRRQAGWKRVDYRGDGLFDVDFAISSQLGHDFVFPTFEQFPMSDLFLAAHLREGRQVRIDAPGFSAQSATGNPFQAMMAGLGDSAAAKGGQAQAAPTPPSLPTLDGTFRIVTDGRILANNTDEGPRAAPGGQALEWRVTPRTPAAPTALIDLGP